MLCDQVRHLTCAPLPFLTNVMLLPLYHLVRQCCIYPILTNKIYTLCMLYDQVRHLTSALPFPTNVMLLPLYHLVRQCCIYPIPTNKIYTLCMLYDQVRHLTGAPLPFLTNV